MKKGHLPAAIANEFLDRSGRDKNPLTPMRLIKLVYFAHGWHLAVTGKPLIDENFQAWKHGPVVPSLFHEFKIFGGGPIDRLAYSASFNANEEFEMSQPFLPETETETKRMIDWVWQKYGGLKGWKLSALTHEADSPWDKAVKEMKAKFGETWVAGQCISDESIRDHFINEWNKIRATPATA